MQAPNEAIDPVKTYLDPLFLERQRLRTVRGPRTTRWFWELITER